ncbi:MAG: hypothetical protein M3441_15175 [Chloroflexota bacterium]|nr:hypothetical protein [Chloroflexota bacterium]
MPQQAASSRGIWVLAVTILGSSMVFIDGAVVDVALPSMETDLNGSVADMQWVVEGYRLCRHCGQRVANETTPYCDQCAEEIVGAG